MADLGGGGGRGFQAVASAQNSPFLAWQALLLASSWRKSFDGTLVVVVHAEPGAELLAEFALLGRAGARLERRRDFATDGPARCLTRNHPGTLLTAPGEAELTVLLDTDLLFTAPVDWGAYPAAQGVVVTATDGYEGYTDAASDGRPGWVEGACRRVGVDFGALAAHGPWGGVPYVVHEDDRGRLAREWVECLDALAGIDTSLDGPVPWTGDMWAFAFATLRLGLEVRHCGSVRQNPWRNPAEPWFRERRTIIHYAHADGTFDKRTYMHAPRSRAVWDLRPTGDGTCTDLVLAEIEEAGRLYGLAAGSDLDTPVAALVV